MTVYIETTPTETDKLPLVLYNNLLPSSSLTASSEATDYLKENVLSENTTKSWKPTSIPALMTFDFGKAVTADSFAVFGHNCATNNLSLVLQSSTDGSTWTDRSVRSLLDNTTHLALFASISARYWKATLSHKNMCSYSEDLSNASWSKSAATVVTNAYDDPFGNTTADKLVESSTTDFHYVDKSVSLVSGRKVTYSVYLKYTGNRTYAQLRSYYVGTNNIRINLVTGAVTVVNNSNITDYGAESVGNGWYRLWMTFVPSATTSALFRIQMISNTLVESYAGDGTSSIAVGGSQIELAELSDYVANTGAIPTTGTPYISGFFLSNKLQFPAGVLPPYTPTWSCKTYDLLTSTTIGGQFLGNRVLYTGGETTINLVSVEADFAKGVLEPFRQHYNKGKAFIWAMSPANYPEDVAYVWRKENSVMQPSFDSDGNWMALGMEVYVYGD